MSEYVGKRSQIVAHEQSASIVAPAVGKQTLVEKAYAVIQARLAAETAQ